MEVTSLSFKKALTTYVEEHDQRTLSAMVGIFSINYLDGDGNYHEESWELLPETVTDYGKTRMGHHLKPGKYKFPLATTHPVKYVIEFSFKGRDSDWVETNTSHSSYPGSYEFSQDLKKKYSNCAPLCPINLGYIGGSGKRMESSGFIAAWYEEGDVKVKMVPENFGDVYPVRFVKEHLSHDDAYSAELISAIEEKFRSEEEYLFGNRLNTVTASAETGGELELEYLTTNVNALLGVKCHICKATTGALREYFSKKYPNNVVAFNREYREILESSREQKLYDPLDALLFSAASETSFVVLNCDDFAEGTAVNPELLDGFMRVLWSDKNDDVIVKVYTDLTDYQQHQVMILANTWKMRTQETAFIFDRGFSLYIWKRTGVILTKELTRALSQYCVQKRDDGIVALWKNKHFMADFRFIHWLAERTQGWATIREETAMMICSRLGSIRNANCDREMRDLDCDAFDRFLESFGNYFEKLVGMKVSGQAVNNLEKNFEPQLTEFLKDQMRGLPAEPGPAQSSGNVQRKGKRKG